MDAFNKMEKHASPFMGGKFKPWIRRVARRSWKNLEKKDSRDKHLPDEGLLTQWVE